MITEPDIGMAVPVHVVKVFLRQAGLNDAANVTAAKPNSNYI